MKKSQEEVVVESFRKVFHVIIRTVAWIMRFNSDIRNFVQLTLSNTFYRTKEKKQSYLKEYEHKDIGFVYPFEIPVFSYRTSSLIPIISKARSQNIIRGEQ